MHSERTWRSCAPAFPRFVQAGMRLALLVLCTAALPSAAADDDPRLAPFKGVAALWSNYHAGKYADAARAAELAQRDAYPAWAQQEAAHVQARCLWAEGTPQSRAAARKIWTALEKLQSLPETAIRLKIAKVLQTTDVAVAPAAGGPAHAGAAHAPAGGAGVGAVPVAPAAIAAGIALLESVVKVQSPHPGAATAEAAMELAKLYGKAKQWDDAFKSLDFAEKHLKFQITRELPAVAAEPFLKAIPALRKRLQLDQDEGRERFNKAESLRKAEKWPDAIAAYRDLLKALPNCKYAPRADLHIGDCLLGEKKPAAAVEHWEKLISAGPGKAWRGQALLGVIDIFLEQQFDLAKARKYAALARQAMEAGLADKDAACAESWRAVAADLCIRGGVTAYVAGDAPEALAWFEDARKHAGGKRGDGIERLVMFIKAGRPVLPEEVAGKMDDQAAVVLALGSVYRMAERWEQAGQFFDLVRQTKVRPRNVAQLAYAAFGKGAALEGAGKTADARPLYENAIKGHPNAPWHDETLFRLAWLIERDAEAKYAKDNRDAAAKEKAHAAKSDKPATPAERQQAATEEKKRLAEFLEQRGAALPHWQEMLKRFPESPYALPAKYHAGMLLADAEKWEPAAKALDAFITAAPLSPHAAGAIVRLIDVRLERLFDLPAARAALPAADKWCSDYDPKVGQLSGVAAGKVGQVSGAAVKPDLREALLSEWDRPASGAELKRAKYDLYLRAGLVAYLDQKYDDAAKLFEAAKPLAPPSAVVIASGKVPTGIENLIDVAKQQKQLTPNQILDGDRQAGLILQIGDVYLHGQNYVQAHSLFANAMNLRGSSSLQKSWALYRQGRCTFGMRFDGGDPLQARDEYLAACRTAPTAQWAGRCLFLAGNIEFNSLRDMEKAVLLWKHVVTEYQNSEDAHRAAYYIAVAYELQKRPSEARKAFESFIQDFPQSPFVPLVRNHHLKRIVEIEKAGSLPAPKK